MNILETEENRENLLPENTTDTENSSEIKVNGQNKDSNTVQSTESIETSQSNVQSEADQTSDKFSTIIIDFTDQLKETNRISQERELVIDRLHQENQRLKQGEIQQALLPIFRDLIRLYDDLNATVSKYVDNLASRDEKIIRDLDCYKETVGDILYRYGVELIEVGPGEDFNPKDHKAVGAVSTGIAEQDRKVSKVIRSGFKTDTRIIRNAEVEVYRYAAPAVENVESQNENTPELIENQSEDK